MRSCARAEFNGACFGDGLSALLLPLGLRLRLLPPTVPFGIRGCDAAVVLRLHPAELWIRTCVPASRYPHRTCISGTPTEQKRGATSTPGPHVLGRIG